MAVTQYSQIVFISGSSRSWASSSAYVLKRVYFWSSMASPIDFAIPGAKFAIKAKIPLIMFLEKAMMRKTTWIETLLTAFPIKVGRKKVMNGI